MIQVVPIKFSWRRARGSSANITTGHCAWCSLSPRRALSASLTEICKEYADISLTSQILSFFKEWRSCFYQTSMKVPSCNCEKKYLSVNAAVKVTWWWLFEFFSGSYIMNLIFFFCRIWVFNSGVVGGWGLNARSFIYTCFLTACCFGTVVNFIYRSHAASLYFGWKTASSALTERISLCM